MSFLLALALVAQQDMTAFRTEKGVYLPAIKRCREAQALIDSDPFSAIEILDSIINNPKIKKVECRLRVEERASEYTKYYLFMPYQYRGRARMNRAAKSQGEAARRHLEPAIADFERSVRAGVTSSAGYLKTARARLAKLRVGTTPPPTVRPDPLIAFRPRWQELILQKKFKSAVDYLRISGKELTAAQRATLDEEAKSECRRLVSRALLDFRRSLASLRSEEELTNLTDRDFRDAFALPDGAELVVTDAGLDWARAHVADLKAVQSKKAPGHSLLKAAMAAAPLVKKGVNPWVRPLLLVVFNSFKTVVSSKIDAARDAPKGERTRLRGEAEVILADLRLSTKDLAALVDKDFPARHGMNSKIKELNELLGNFPVDLAELAQIDITACFSAPSPVAELDRVEKALRELAPRQGVTLESRRTLHTRIVLVGALRGLLQGKTEKEVAADLEADAAKLKGVGGPENTATYGPRVSKVFEILFQ